MGLVSHTRALLQIGQQDLSKYLSIKRSLLNMVERDERFLPNEKYAQVMELNQYLEVTTPLEELTKVKAYQQTEKQDLQVYIQEQIVLLKLQQKQLQEKLEKQQTTYETRLRAYHALARANDHMGDKPEYQQSWLRLHYTLTKEKLAQNGRRAILKLELKLAKVTSELAVLEAKTL